MTDKNYKHLYSRFLTEHSGEWHFACHSHHYWPDVSREAHIQYWDDSAKYVDDKWDFIFEEKTPQLQRYIAKELNLSHPKQIAFAPNTHEFVFRLLSCLDLQKNQKIVTTDSEFHSFDRQSKRLAELSNINLIRVPRAPFDTFQDRFLKECKDANFIFVSQVAFNSGVMLRDLNEMVMNMPEDAIKVIDGYHGFMAVPTDLSKIEDRVFYLAGGYKYAQAGEGGCFVAVPPNCTLRPLYTGWFARFDDLGSDQSDQIEYSQDGMRFAGSTMDYSAIYRMLAVFKEFEKQQLSSSKIHDHVTQVQAHFLMHLDQLDHPLINRDNLLFDDLNHHGHFYTFELTSNEQVSTLAKALKAKNVLCDYRENKIRFGFALYHSIEDMNFKIPD